MSDGCYRSDNEVEETPKVQTYAHHLRALEEDRRLLNWIRRACRVVYYPTDGRYPIEHAPTAKKDQWAALIAEQSE